MKTSFLVFFVFFCCFGSVLSAQLNGTYNIPGAYATISSAVSALNAAGVGMDGVTFNVAANHSEILTGRIDLTVTGYANRPIIFQKSGTGANPLITAYTGISDDANNPDGIWSLSGCDYVTIDGIDLYDPNTASTITMMEYGYGLFLSSTTYGAQYNTIKNCVITLNRNNECYNTLTQVKGSVAILAINAFTNTLQSDVMPPSQSVTNSYNRFYANRTENCSMGIVLKGYNSGVPVIADQGNDIGGISPATGNQILNFGGGNTTHDAIGIKSRYQWESNISYNIINNNNGAGINHTYTLTGIDIAVSLNADITVSHNTVTIKSGSTVNSSRGIFSQAGSTLVYNTVDITNNLIQDCTNEAGGTAGFNGIVNTGNMGTINITGNTVENCTQAANGSFSCIYNTDGQDINISANILRNNTFTGDYGSMHMIRLRSANNNVINNQIYGISATPASETSSTNIAGIYFDAPTTTDSGIYSGNSIYNFSISGSNKAPNSSILGFNLAGNNSSAVKQICDNQIYGFTYNTGRNASLTGISAKTGETTIARNRIYGFQANGNSNIRGISSYQGVIHIYNNMLYDLDTAQSSGQPSTQAIYASGTCHVSYNTVYLSAAGIHASYSSTALFLSYLDSITYLKNNIFVNKSTPGSSGKIAAVWCAYTDTSTLGAGSDHNIYYSGIPDARHLIGNFSWNTYPTLADYQAVLVDREQNTMTEDVPFVSVTGTIDLHINPSIFTLAEGNAIPIAGITGDYDNQDRDAATPDVGADEGDFISTYVNDLAVLSMTGWTIGFEGWTNNQLITIKNLGTCIHNSYSLRLMSSDGPSELASQNVTIPLYPDQTAEINLSWNPSAAGAYHIYGEVAADGDENSANDTSAVSQVNIYALSTYAAIVGDQESTTVLDYLPLCFGARNSLSETIYTATEMQMHSGTIEGIIYYSYFTQDILQKPVKVWMKNTTANDLSTGWLDFAGYTLVFDGLLDFFAGENNFVHIPLSIPFDYSGENLALRINRPIDTQFYDDFNTAFYYSTPMYVNNRSRYLVSNSIAYNPESPSAAGTLVNDIPLTTFIAPASVPVMLSAPEVNITRNGTDVLLDWNPVPGAYCYRVFISTDAYTWSDFPDAVIYTENYSHAYASEEKKFFRVVAASTYN